VKYYFITDSIDAPVKWGLQLAHYPLIAILLSLFAVITEMLAITAAFSRSTVYRLALGVASLGLLSGFWMFMGVFWPGWWILLVGFLPWQWLRPRGPAAASTAALRPAFNAPVFVIAIVIAQQVVFSNVRREQAPMFSHYPMYSGTFSSPAEYAAKKSPRYRIVAATDAGQAELRSCPPHDEFVRLFQSALDGSAQAKSEVWKTLAGCSNDFGAVRQVSLEGELEVFDWERLVIDRKPVPPIGPLLVDGPAADADVMANPL
jgi:hypothetical protein